MDKVELSYWEKEHKGQPCKECWEGYPVKCNKCGGLKHAMFDDEDSSGETGNWWLKYWCENCGNEIHQDIE
jgi:hypothetical protein